jgi:bifunctional DNA-binding transcriptional regulator/antitoxin component of YhaV-PrlF toxin-antitoxin module
MNQKLNHRYTLELGTNGRLTLPADLRKRLKYQAGDVFVLSVQDAGRLELRAGQDVAKAARGVLKTMKNKKVKRA